VTEISNIGRTDIDAVQTSIQSMLLLIVRAIVDTPDRVTVQTEIKGDVTVLLVTVAPNDIGQVIGVSGRTARSLRTVVNAAAPPKTRFELNIQAGPKPSQK
jgi:predicted RNA-binding protein YlqC (UPF0109 family)